MIQLYRKGCTHTVRGIECELGNFQATELETMLSDGWVKDPSELTESKPEKASIETMETKELHPVRQAAKDAGIAGWDTKRIKTLEQVLND